MCSPSTWDSEQAMKIQTKKIKLGYRLFPYQADVIKGILKYPNDIHICKSKRQVGKSITVETILMYFAINKGNSCSIAISPTLNQGRKLFREVKRALQATPVFESANSSTLEIWLNNGSSIKFKSGEQEDALRGETVSGILCIDEAVYIKDEVIFNTFPFVDVHKAPILLTSTPKFRTGVFYDYYVNGINHEPGFHSYDVCKYDTSALLSPERLEMYRRSVAPQIFKSEFLGEFLDTVSELFGDIKKLCGKVITPSNEIVMGVDWSNGAMDKGGDPDETAVCIMNGHRQLVKIDSFSDKDSIQTIDYLITMIKTYNVKKVVCETNSMGATYINLLKRKIASLGIKCQVIEFTTSNESKREIIEDLQIHCQNGTIQLIEDNKLMLQMMSYMVEKTPTGKITYNGSVGIHDDCVIALALSLWGLKKGTYNIR